MEDGHCAEVGEEHDGWCSKVGEEQSDRIKS